MSFACSPKSFIAIAPTSVTNGGTATGTVDTLGIDMLTLLVHTSTSDSTSNNPSVLKIEEGDTTSSYAAITELTGDGVGGFTIADAVTSGNWTTQFNLDTRARKRYLKISVSPTTTQTVTVVGIGQHNAEAPITATLAGVNSLVQA